jgi:transcriptional regulator with XRE-family HTH domain
MFYIRTSSMFYSGTRVNTKAAIVQPMSLAQKNIVGDRVRRARTTRKITQDQLSAQLATLGVQIDRAGISKIENGSRRVYDFELRAVARVLETEPSWFLTGAASKESRPADKRPQTSKRP